MKPKPEQLGELIRQINDRGSQRAALFCAPSKGGEANRAQPDEVAAAIDIERRTVEVAFASETEEVERWYGIEILDCSPESVDLSRLASGAPVLDMHDQTQQVGVVDEARADSDRICRALLRYSRGPQGQLIFDDIVDGIRTKVSVGYRVLDMVLERQSDDGPDVYRVTRWQPFEISNVSVPADDGAGVGRSAAGTPGTPEPRENPEESDDASASGAARSAVPGVSDSPATPKQTETREANTMDPKELEAAREAARKQGGVDEAQRVSDILDVARQHNADSTLVDAMLRDASKTQHDLVLAILNARADEQGTRAAEPTIGMSDKEVREFSFVRLFRAMSFPDNKAFREAAAFEMECSSAASEIYKGERKGNELIPHDVLIASRALDLNHLRQRGFDTRALSATLGDTGDALVGTQHLAASFIDLLRNRMALASLGATTLTGLNGNLAIPRQTGGATMYWLDPENSDIPAEGLPTFDQVALTPKNAAAFTEMSRQLLLQSSPDVENLVRMDLAKQMALGLDKAAFYGTGANGQPKGIVNQTGINATDFTAVLPTWAEVVDMETQVALDNADGGNAAYVMGAGMRGHLKTTEKFSGSNGAPIWGDNGLVNGYRPVVSNQIAAGDLFFGNFSDVLIGMWGGLDMLVNPYSGDKAGTVRITAHQSCDTNVRHPESFNHGKQHTP